MAEPRSRDGYALLAVLWLMAGLGGLVLSITAGATYATTTSRNRIALAQARWEGIGCLARIRQITDAAIAAEEGEVGSGRAWRRLDQVILQAHDTGCELNVRSIGGRVDLNAVEPDVLYRLLRYAGFGEARSQSVAATLIAARPYADRRAIPAVAGAESLIDSLFDLTPQPAVLSHSPAAVLRLLPGFTEEVVRRVIESRERSEPITSFHELNQLLDPADSSAPSRLPGLLLLHPPGWTIVVRSRSGSPAVTMNLEASLIPLTKSVGIAKRRSWID